VSEEFKAKLWELVNEWSVSIDEEDRILANLGPMQRAETWLKMEGKRDAARELRTLLKEQSNE
jgi:hypothetical protein